MPRTGLPGNESLTAVHTVSATDIRAVGTYVDPNSASNRRKLILQRTGGASRTAAAPTVATYESLAAIDATGSTDAWAVGAATGNAQSGPLAPLVPRWNGTSWTQETTPGSSART